MPKKEVKPLESENEFGDLEFTKPADRLVEAIVRRLTETGREVNAKEVCKIAFELIEKRAE